MYQAWAKPSLWKKAMLYPGLKVEKCYKKTMCLKSRGSIDEKKQRGVKFFDLFSLASLGHKVKGKQTFVFVTLLFGEKCLMWRQAVDSWHERSGSVLDRWSSISFSFQQPQEETWLCCFSFLTIFFDNSTFNTYKLYFNHKSQHNLDLFFFNIPFLPDMMISSSDVQVGLFYPFWRDTLANINAGSVGSILTEVETSLCLHCSWSIFGLRIFLLAMTNPAQETSSHCRTHWGS